MQHRSISHACEDWAVAPFTIFTLDRNSRGEKSRREAVYPDILLLAPYELIGAKRSGAVSLDTGSLGFRHPRKVANPTHLIPVFAPSTQDLRIRFWLVRILNDGRDPGFRLLKHWWARNPRV